MRKVLVFSLLMIFGIVFASTAVVHTSVKNHETTQVVINLAADEITADDITRSCVAIIDDGDTYIQVEKPTCSEAWKKAKAAYEAVKSIAGAG